MSTRVITVITLQPVVSTCCWMSTPAFSIYHQVPAEMAAPPIRTAANSLPIRSEPPPLPDSAAACPVDDIGEGGIEAGLVAGDHVVLAVLAGVEHERHGESGSFGSGSGVLLTERHCCG